MRKYNMEQSQKYDTEFCNLQSWARSRLHVQAITAQLFGIYAERDGDDAGLHGEALRRFIRGWREIGGDRRRIKGV